MRPDRGDLRRALRPTRTVAETIGAALARAPPPLPDAGLAIGVPS